MTTAYLFPGQGSQKLGMGQDVFDQYPELVAAADQELGYSIKELCLTDANKRLDNTQYTQPALFIVSALSFLSRVQASGGRLPDFALGHSVGEYAALFSAGVFDFITGVRLVKRRGEMMSRAQGGGMAAVIGLPPAKIQDLLKNFAFDAIDVANYNSPEQTVVSGPAADIDEVRPILEEAGARMVLKLKVSGAFHSRLMKDASSEFAGFLESIQLRSPKFPVISNVEARPYDPARTKELLSAQICQSVRWTDSIQFLLSRGEVTFEEIGPGRVLTKLLTQIPKP